MRSRPAARSRRPRSRSGTLSCACSIGRWPAVSARLCDGDEIENVHIAAGYTIAGLVALRIVWGFVGPRHARFSDFIRSPRAVLAYMRDVALLQAPRYLGHNPAGGAMVVAMIVTLIGSCTTGYMMMTGPSGAQSGWRRCMRRAPTSRRPRRRPCARRPGGELRAPREPGEGDDHREEASIVSEARGWPGSRVRTLISRRTGFRSIATFGCCHSHPGLQARPDGGKKTAERRKH